MLALISAPSNLAVLAPQASGAQVTVFDPDLDPGGQHAALLASILVTGLRQLGTAPGRP